MSSSYAGDKHHCYNTQLDAIKYIQVMLLAALCSRMHLHLHAAAAGVKRFRRRDYRLEGAAITISSLRVSIDGKELVRGAPTGSGLCGKNCFFNFQVKICRVLCIFIA